MNANKINRWICNVPALNLMSLTSLLPVKETCDVLDDLKRLDQETGQMAQIALVDLAMQLVISSDPIIVAKVWIEFLRNPVFRRYVLALRMVKTSRPPKLPAACARMGWSDDLVYDMTAVSMAVLAEGRPDLVKGPIPIASISCRGKMLELIDGKLELDLEARLQFMKGAVHNKFWEAVSEPESEPVPEPEPEPESPAFVPEPEPEPAPEPATEPPKAGVESVQELDNKQKLVRVRSRNGNVHYIVVDEGVDIERAPQVWDLINRDELRLSVNVTTDRLARSKVINDYLAEGWTPSEVAELMSVPKHIVTGDIHLLRKLDRLGDTPGMRKRKRNQ